MSTPIDEGQRALQFMLEKSANRTDLLKKGLLLVAGIFGVGFAVWYFVLRQPTALEKSIGAVGTAVTGAPAGRYPLVDQPYAVLGGVLPTDTAAVAETKVAQAKTDEAAQIARAQRGGVGGL